jgi:hypothetical protein
MPKPNALPRLIVALAVAIMLVASSRLVASPQPTIFATTRCEATTGVFVIDYTASANVLGSNPSVDILVNGVVVDNGEFAPPAYEFSGTVPAPGGAGPGTIVVVSLHVLGTWTDGTNTAEGGQTHAVEVTLPPDACGLFKTFSFSNSMEGDLARIRPGDWISGGYSFKFKGSSHGATTYTVATSITLPVYCPDGGGPGGNIIIPMGTQTYNIAAGNTSWTPTGDQNSILSWQAAVQAPDLCGGQRMRNQIGATFTLTVLQSPQVGLVDWRFHYRDPAAKGKPNTNCTNALDPNRNKADVCGASWSQTFIDP